jgi:uncharacterized repeat protein (TIGR01451 family)/LPXTG-motif cell wall-anchored protein
VLAIGATDDTTITGTYVVTQADIDAGTDIVNTATAISDEGAEDTDSATVTITQTPSIDLLKTGVLDTGGDGVATPGDVITYSFTVENLGNVTLTNVTLADTVGGVTISGGPIATMAPGDDPDVSTFTGSYVITLADINAGRFHNVATVTGTPPGENPPVTDDGDADTPLPQNPGIRLFKNGALNLGPDGMINPGDTILYTFTVENTGNVTLSGLVLTDLDFGDLDVTCPWDGNPAFDFLPGFVNRENCTAEYSVTQADIDAGEVNNCATIEATTPSEQTVEAEACTTVDEPPEAEIDIVKTAMTPEVNVGDLVRYEIAVTNIGNVTLSNVQVIDALVPDCDRTFGAIVIPGETVTYGCAIANVIAGFENVAVVTGMPPMPTSGEEPQPVEATDRALVVVILDGSIGDLVWNDANENGVRDGDEKGVAGVTLRLTLPDGSTRETTTNADGAYVFEALPEGEYTVEIVLSSVVLASGEDVHLVTAGFLGIGADDATVDVLLLAASAGTDLRVTTPTSYTVQLSAGENYLDADFGVVAVLPITGLDTTTIALIALALLLAGGLAVFVSSRKREDQGDMAA